MKTKITGCVERNGDVLSFSMEYNPADRVVTWRNGGVRDYSIVTKADVSLKFSKYWGSLYAYRTNYWSPLYFESVFQAADAVYEREQRMKRLRASLDSSPRTIRSAKMWYYGGGSDKVYNIALKRKGNSNYEVSVDYGRRQATHLNHLVKYSGPSKWQAEDTFNKLFSEKSRKGYEW